MTVIWSLLKNLPATREWSIDSFLFKLWCRTLKLVDAASLQCWCNCAPLGSQTLALNLIKCGSMIAWWTRTVEGVLWQIVSTFLIHVFKMFDHSITVHLAIIYLYNYQICISSLRYCSNWLRNETAPIYSSMHVIGLFFALRCYGFVMAPEEHKHRIIWKIYCEIFKVCQLVLQANKWRNLIHLQ